MMLKLLFTGQEDVGYLRLALPTVRERTGSEKSALEQAEGERRGSKGCFAWGAHNLPPVAGFPVCHLETSFFVFVEVFVCTPTPRWHKWGVGPQAAHQSPSLCSRLSRMPW